MSTEQKKLYNAEIYQKANGTDNITLVGEPVPKNCKVELGYLIGSDETTTGKTIRVGYKRNGTLYWLQQEPAATNYHTVEFDSTLILGEGEQPAVMIESPTDADECYLFARGLYIEG